MVLNYDGKELLAQYLPSVVEAATSDGDNHEIIVVDNASRDDSVQFLHRQFPQVRVCIMSQNRRFFSYNQIVNGCESDYIVLLNNDVRVEPHFIGPLLEHFQDPQVFAVMPKIVSATAGEAYTSRCLGRFKYGLLSTGREDRLSGFGNTLFAHGAAAAYDREKFIDLGGFDPLYWTEYYEEVDLSYRAWMRGWRVLFDPQSSVYHYAGGTVNRVYSDAQKRQQRIKVRNLFVLKNIVHRGMLARYSFWFGLRLVRAILLRDKSYLRGCSEIWRLRSRIAQARQEVNAMRIASDREIFARIRANV